MKSLAALSFLVWFTTSEASYAPKVEFQWNYINFTWPDQDTIRNQSYIVENNSISGIKVWKDRIYLTIPRWKKGIPVTLASIPVASGPSPLLEPYPDWEMQKLDDCLSFQFVLGVEIDPIGRMWIIDNGRTELLASEPRINCPPRLVVLDLEKEGQVIFSYVFPEEVAHCDSVLLNDIVLDHEDSGMAYITDTDDQDPGIIVFSLENMTSWKVRDESMRGNDEASELIVNGTKLVVKSPVNGIALDPVSVTENRSVYYTALSSYEIFTIPTSVLKNPNLTNETYSGYVQSLGKKGSQSDGIGMSAYGVLYFGLLAKDAVGMWDTKKKPFTENQNILVEDHEIMQWPNSFAFDTKGRIWFIINKMQKFRTNSMDMNIINYRIITANVSSHNYQYWRNGSYPSMPLIEV
ncbi:protein yellow-like [Copidosoma floridanum]|uniref:protein yellow-like n=1 Tax=Copidosoma floridanum TaxID=29053 RepID=UPI0006C99F9B|nr:protein yellow-like [Copidosoma floridanum]